MNVDHRLRRSTEDEHEAAVDESAQVLSGGNGEETTNYSAKTTTEDKKTEDGSNLAGLEFLKTLDGDEIEISISHERDYAIATAIFC